MSTINSTDNTAHRHRLINSTYTIHIILTTVTLCSAASQTVCSGASSRSRTRQRDSSPALVDVTDHITPVLRQLHRLPVRQRVDFKLALLVYKALQDATAAYLVDDCQLVSRRPSPATIGRHRHVLCSTDQHSVRRPELCSRWTAAFRRQLKSF